MRLKKRIESDSIHGPNVREAKTRKDKAKAYWKGLNEWRRLTTSFEKQRWMYHYNQLWLKEKEIHAKSQTR
jgi:hypothetical protein